MNSLASIVLAGWRSMLLRDARLRLAAILLLLVSALVGMGLIAGTVILEQVAMNADWARSLFPWDPMPRVPKILVLLFYLASLGVGIFTIGLLIRVINTSSSDAGKVLDRIRCFILMLMHLRPKGGHVIVLLACLPLFWALFITPFRIPNEFLAIETQTVGSAGEAHSTTEYLRSHDLEGLKIPLLGEVSEPLALPVAGGSASGQARQLVFRFPELYWYDEVTGLLEVHRIGDVSQYESLLMVVAPEAREALQRRFREDMGDALALATRKYTTEEKAFISLNRPELERSLVLGRFFYHHDFIFLPAVVTAQDPHASHGSQYGEGLTQTFAFVLSMVPADVRFNTYLLFLYISYPLYLALIMVVCRACGLTSWQTGFVAAVTVCSFLVSTMETIRLGVGLAPWRHFLDVLVFYGLWLYGARSSLLRWGILATLVFSSLYWSREMGLFIGLAAVGVLFFMWLKDGFRGLGGLGGLAGVVTLGWLLSDPNAQALNWAVPLGANTPDVPWGFIVGTAMIISASLAAWFWLTPRQGEGLQRGLWGVTGAAVMYAAFSAIYLMYYPRPHHIAPTLPAMALGAATGWALLIQSRCKGDVGKVASLLAGTVTTVVMLSMCALALLRAGEVVGEYRIFGSHVSYPWNFPAGRLSSTGDPALLEESVKMIHSHNPQATVDILSPWEVVLLPLSGKGKNGPFLLSFDSLLTDREISLLADHLVREGNEMLFVDSRIVNGQYELPLLEDAYMRNRVLASVLRVRAHAMLREVFARIQGCYRMEEEGPLVSAWRRVSKDCLS